MELQGVFFMCNDPSDSSKVTKISCIIYKEFYGENKNELDKLKGKVKEMVMVVRWIEGTDVIKKCNAETHRASNVHTLAVQRLREKQKTASDGSSSSSTEAQRIAQSSSNITQTSIVDHARNATKQQIQQLVKKFQLAHFLTVNNKSFNFYQSLVRFEKDIHKVNVGTGYLNNKSCSEIIHYLSKAMVQENITEPLNNKERLY